MKHILFSSAILLCLAACSKHAGDTEPDPHSVPAATLTLSSPVAGAHYNYGDTVWFRGTAVSTATIHGYDLSVRRANDSASLYYQHYHNHNDTIQINQYWVNDRTVAGDLEAGILLTLDHEGHVLERKVAVHVH
ncbi:MAG: hypothetical protein EOO11_04030 [Chitinophagaceae bacterium]|nr:MAG: hypothetical protein EOO11_04030 [Chitinophagaceae bacterium]